ncbi:hypothetical protein MTR_6g083160 [Medicago truncatula]|uniref:Uncharacterized protein n=1 Tax=Medicago truncatula TaxID=3880 RepID=A0A072UBM2_MEDTR|nr:hypothetical protein MTR_6g083160 [Medicago truncatula]
MGESEEDCNSDGKATTADPWLRVAELDDRSMAPCVDDDGRGEDLERGDRIGRTSTEVSLGSETRSLKVVRKVGALLNKWNLLWSNHSMEVHVCIEVK